MTQEFHMTIGTTPNRLNVEKDLSFIKVGLLYGDRVKLDSISSSFLLDVLNIYLIRDEKDKFQVMQMFMEALGRPDIKEAMKILYKRGNLSQAELIMKMQLRQQINNNWEKIRNKTLEILANSGIEGLKDALDTGLLQIERYAMSDNSGFSETIIIDFVNNLNGAVLSGKTYPIFDKNMADLIRLKNDEIDITTSEQLNKRMRHGGLTFDFLNRLPSFELASINEIVDIRRELNDPLIKFRSLMLKYSSEINSELWQDAFLLEVDQKFREDVEPVVQELEEAVKSTSYMRELTSQIFNNTWEAPATTLGLTIATVSEYLNVSQACIAGGAKLAYDSVTAYNRYKENKKNIEDHQMYFYYKAGKMTKAAR